MDLIGAQFKLLYKCQASGVMRKALKIFFSKKIFFSGSAVPRTRKIWSMVQRYKKFAWNCFALISKTETFFFKNNKKTLYPDPFKVIHPIEIINFRYKF